MALVLLLLAGLGVGLFFLANSLLGEAPQVVVPRCVGNTRRRVPRELLEDRGLKVRGHPRSSMPRPHPTWSWPRTRLPGDQVDEGTR